MKCKECPEYADCVTTADLRRKRRKCGKAREEKRKTNGDCIRAMSDEELADMFAEFAEENPSDDANAWYEWLTKPAEVE